MLTYLFSVLISFLIAGVIFKKKIKQNLIGTAFIVVGGSLLACSLVNGLLGTKYPTQRTLIKEKNLKLKEIDLCRDHKLYDTTFYDLIGHKAFLDYDFILDDLYLGASGLVDHKPENWSEIKIHYLDSADTTTYPYYKIYREVFQIPENSLWFVDWALPRINPTYEVWIPGDSVHQRLMEYVNLYLEADEDPNITKINSKIKREES